jgi:hypothetical protein
MLADPPPCPYMYPRKIGADLSPTRSGPKGSSRNEFGSGPVFHFPSYNWCRPFAVLGESL